VVIEVKGSWNSEVTTAMRQQLVGNYLDPQKIRAGLFVVGYFTCGSWNKGKRYRQSVRCGTARELEGVLRAQAIELTSGIREVRSWILDAALPDKSPKNIKAARKRGLKQVGENRELGPGFIRNAKRGKGSAKAPTKPKKKVTRPPRAAEVKLEAKRQRQQVQTNEAKKGRPPTRTIRKGSFRD
jgi:hypothetical protein